MTEATFQSDVRVVQGFGVPGELFSDAPHVVQPYRAVSTPEVNVVGYAMSVVSEGVAKVGGTGIFAGILVHPKEYELSGDGVGTLNPSLEVADNTEVQCCTMGEVVVSLPAAAAIGDVVIYDETTGALETIAPAAALPAGKQNAYAYVSRYALTAAGLAVIMLNRTPELAV